jgi:hypothetical protein
MGQTSPIILLGWAGGFEPRTAEPKSPGATEITHLSDLTRAGNPHEAGGDPAGQNWHRRVGRVELATEVGDVVRNLIRAKTMVEK